MTHGYISLPTSYSPQMYPCPWLFWLHETLLFLFTWILDSPHQMTGIRLRMGGAYFKFKN